VRTMSIKSFESNSSETGLPRGNSNVQMSSKELY